MLYLCVNAQNYITTITLHDIKFRKTDKFKYLESIIPKNDDCGSEIKRRRFKQERVWMGEKIIAEIHD